MTTEALNILRTIRSKKLWAKFTEEILEKIVQRRLLKRDGSEFGTEWAKERAKSMMASEKPEESDDEDYGASNSETKSQVSHIYFHRVHILKPAIQLFFS